MKDDEMCPSEVIDDNTSAGYRLRCAREGLHLSMRDIASALNLLVSHVRAIESDRCDTLAKDDQFLRYLYDYASLVDLDARELVDSYRTQSANIFEPIQPQLAEDKQRHNGAFIVVGALAITSVLLGSWLLSQNQTLSSESSNPALLRHEATEKKPSNVPSLLTNNRTASINRASEENTRGENEPAVLFDRAQHADDTDSPAVSHTELVDTSPGKDDLHTVGTTLPNKIPGGLVNEDNAQAPPQTSTKLAQKETFTRLRSTEWIAGLAPARYTLQLLSLTKEASAQAFIRSRHIEDQAAYVAVRNDDQRTWYAVIYGLYDSVEAAESASRSLPDSIKDLKPRVRNIGRVQQLMLR
jgi:septal ring-binding cell division protein DamX/transcriptional regulator with XRE-family HTH domain